MQTINLSADRPTLEITRGGETFRWQYDVLTLKLECDRLEVLHKLREGDRVKTPTVPMLADFAAYLTTAGLEECSIDTAYRMYMLVGVQFAKLAKNITEQVAALN